MDLDEFVRVARLALPDGYTFDNPGGGTSQIVASNEVNVAYRRGRSRIGVRWEDLHGAYVGFAGRYVSSSDLRRRVPSVFDSAARPAGHSCNCTFLFHLLERLSLTIGGLQGRGVAGSPFGVQLKALGGK